MLGSKMNITSYTARHTWATMARNNNVPLSIISVGLGHTNEGTTRIYLGQLDNSAIDSANSSLLKNLQLQ